jgi:hypothetical protein
VRRTVTAAVSSRSPGSDGRPAPAAPAAVAAARPLRRAATRSTAPDADHGCRRGEGASARSGAGAQGPAEQHEVHRVARDPRPEPHRRRPAAGEQPGRSGELAQPHGSRRAARVGVAGGAHRAGDVLRRRDRGDPEREADQPEAASQAGRAGCAGGGLVVRRCGGAHGAAPSSSDRRRARSRGQRSTAAGTRRRRGGRARRAGPPPPSRPGEPSGTAPRPGKTRRDRGVALREHATPDPLP